MNKMENKFVRDYKAIERQVEDVVMTDLNDKISVYVDATLSQKLTETIALRKDLICTIDKVTVSDNFLHLNDNYFKEMNKYLEAIKLLEIDNNQLSKDVSKIIADTLKPYITEMNEVIYITKYLNMQKTFCNLIFARNKLVQTTDTLSNKIFEDSYKPYFELLIQEFDNIYSKITKKEEEFLKWTETVEVENKKPSSRLEKIMNIDKMDKVLIKLGYTPIRQTGSHKVYNNGVKSIPVPQHSSLNKGLSYTIQKQAYQI